MPKKFNVDESAARFEPVVVTLRGVDYVLGERAAQLFDLTEMSATVKTARDVFTNVRPMLAILAPTAPQELTAAEEMALVKPLQEVLESFMRLTFPSASSDPSGPPAEG